MTKFNEILVIPNWRRYTLENTVDEIDLLVSLANWLWQEDFTKISYFAYLTNNFHIKKPETYKKAMASNQTKD